MEDLSWSRIIVQELSKKVGLYVTLHHAAEHDISK